MLIKFLAHKKVPVLIMPCFIALNNNPKPNLLEKSKLEVR